MRAAFLDEARQDEVSHAVQDVLHKQGAMVSDHSSSRVLFRDYRPGGKYTWDRGGYVGIYQHAGEPEVEVRLRLRARWPWRLLWLSALFNIVMILAVIAINPSGTVWFSVAALGTFLLVATGLLYVNTWKPVWREERALMELLEAELERGFGADDVETAEERELRELEEQLEGELEKRRLRQMRKLADADAEGAGGKRRGGLPAFRMPRPSFQMPGRKAAKGADAPIAAVEAGAERDEAAAGEARIASLEARRAELLARKAALQAERGDDASEKKRRLSVSMPKMPKFGRKGKAATTEDPSSEGEETPEERRARLMARKAELEAQRAAEKDAE